MGVGAGDGSCHEDCGIALRDVCGGDGTHDDAAWRFGDFVFALDFQFYEAHREAGVGRVLVRMVPAGSGRLLCAGRLADEAG